MIIVHYNYYEEHGQPSFINPHYNTATYTLPWHFLILCNGLADVMHAYKMDHRIASIRSKARHQRRRCQGLAFAHTQYTRGKQSLARHRLLYLDNPNWENTFLDLMTEKKFLQRGK